MDSNDNAIPPSREAADRTTTHSAAPQRRLRLAPRMLSDC